MTTSTTADFSDTSERAHYRKLLNQLKEYMDRGFYFKITKDHHDAIDFYRNDQIQEVLKYSDQGKA